SSRPHFAHKSRLNREYNFDNFVVGQANEFSYAAAQGVVAQPATDYNPLFLYGGVGLGKTHLMHAIGNELAQKMGLRVLYLTSEEFLNDMLRGIQTNKMSEFHEKFRVQCDVLLIDDIQFISDKQRTQEEFFHTFNSLQANKKQIVISADKSPQEIKGLEERLISRFSGGLPVEIKAPELEMRIAILREKAANEKIDLPEEVAQYIANKVTSNVRELEGCLKRVIARAVLSKERINLRVAMQVIEPYIKQRAAIVTPEAIIQKVSVYYGVSYAEIMGKSRTKPIVFPRQMAMYLSRQHTSMSLPELGRVFGRDHTTVINAIERVKLAMAADPSVAADVQSFERVLIKLKS
ncbi:MAG: chromosomal replication initiator protein DnaA, partial [Bradymonadales bacterium]